MNIVWTKQVCPFCKMAKSLLEKHNIQYEEREIGNKWTREQLLEEIPSARTVPQIIFDGKVIGGYEQLKLYLEQR